MFLTISPLAGCATNFCFVGVLKCFHLQLQLTLHLPLNTPKQPKPTNKKKKKRKAVHEDCAFLCRSRRKDHILTSDCCIFFRNTETTYLKDKNHVSRVANSTGHLTLQMSVAETVLEYLQSSISGAPGGWGSEQMSTVHLQNPTYCFLKIFALSVFIFKFTWWLTTSSQQATKQSLHLKSSVLRSL